VLAGQGAAKFIQEGTYSIYPVAIYLEEQNFLKWKIMVALRTSNRDSLKYRVCMD
jgi:hypothetical protein